MAKKTLTLDELKVESFAISLTGEQMNNTKGGIYIIKGRRYNYRVRWTALDTRVDFTEGASESNGH